MKKQTLTVFSLLVMMFMMGITLNAVAPQYRQLIKLTSEIQAYAESSESIDGMFINVHQLEGHTLDQLNSYAYPPTEECLVLWDHGRFQIAEQRLLDREKRGIAVVEEVQYYVSNWYEVYVFSDEGHVIISRQSGAVTFYPKHQPMPEHHLLAFKDASEGNRGTIYEVSEYQISARH